MWAVFSIEFYTTIDYHVYYENFSYPLQEWEIGYRTLASLFKPVGFIVFNSVVVAFEMYTIYFMLRRLVPPQFYWIGILILILDSNCSFMYMDMKRQFFAMAISMWTAYFLFFSNHKNKYIIAIATFICAILVHGSAYTSILYFGIVFIKYRPNKVAIITIATLYFLGSSLSLTTILDSLWGVVELFGIDERYYLYIEGFEDFDTDSVYTGTLTIIYQLIVLVLLMVHSKSIENNIYPYVVCYILSLVFSTFLIGEFWRLNYYYSMFNIIVIPILISKLYDRKNILYWSIVCLSIFMPLKSYYYVMSGANKTHIFYKVPNFYTIFHESVDKNYYSPTDVGIK